MKLRSLAAAAAVALILPLGGCADDGQLEPDTRAKLEDASRWGHRISMGARGAIVAVNVACEANDSAFCMKALPIAAKAAGAVNLFDSALAIADEALTDTGTPEEQLAAALGDLIRFEREVEDFIKQLQTAEAPASVLSAIQAAEKDFDRVQGWGG
jgi:hypothetical protein